jgi:hypothetical protein
MTTPASEVITEAKSPFVSDSSAFGPCTTSELHDALTNLYSGVPRTQLPIEMLYKAVDVTTALRTLGATGVFMLVGKYKVTFTWHFHDVIIEVVVGESGNTSEVSVGISGFSRVASRPVVKISTVINALYGAIELANYQYMLRSLPTANYKAQQGV